MATTSRSEGGPVPIPDDELFEHSGRVKGKVVIITGAAKGIGREAALRFASYGANVIIGDLDIAGAQRTASELNACGGGGQAIAQKCDVTVWEDIVTLFELAIRKFNAVDVVVSNAGIGEPKSFLKVTLDRDGKPQKPSMPTIQVNLIGTMHTVHAGQHYLQVNREPEKTSLKAIVVMGSMSSWQAFPLAPVYSAAKHGVLGLMRALDPLLAMQGVRIACITPFFADTAIIPSYLKLGLAGVPLTPLSRIAGAIFYAASHPDPATSGCAYVLPDNGLVMKVPKEEFKEGVYKLLDARANSIVQGVTGIVYYARFTRDILSVVGKPLLVSAAVLGLSRALWLYRDTLQTFMY